MTRKDPYYSHLDRVNGQISKSFSKGASYANNYVTLKFKAPRGVKGASLIRRLTDGVKRKGATPRKLAYFIDGERKTIAEASTLLKTSPDTLTTVARLYERFTAEGYRVNVVSKEKVGVKFRVERFGEILMERGVISEVQKLVGTSREYIYTCAKHGRVLADGYIITKVQ